MFNNRFNSTHKDPLVEAVRQAQQDGEIRRQAEALVNEEFGVYSRNAVVRENLAAYDTAIEEAYANLKEGNKENKEKKKEHEEKTGMEHIKKMGGFPGQSLKRTARSLTKEEKADKDYDRDGKIESEKDEVWGSRLRAAKKAGKMEEGAVDAGSYEGSKSVTKSAPKEDPSTPKSYPGAASSAPTAARLSNAKAAVSPIKEDEQLDEVSKKAAISAYRQKEGEERDTSKLHGLIKRKWGKETAKHAERAGAQDTVGLVRRGEDRGKEDSIARDRRYPRDRMTKSGKVHKQDTATLKGNIKRRLGSHTKPGHLPEEQIDEAAYSAKAARAGKDIGKPGKMFAKIAAKAGERYGSEERGQKVAGAILKKIRAKHVKEENLEELSAFERAFASAKGKNFSFGGKQYSGARADAKTPTTSAPTKQPGAPDEKSTQSFLNKELGRTTSAPQGPEAPAPKANVPLPPRKPESMSLPRIDTAPKVPDAGMPNPKVNAPTPPASSARPSAPAPAPMQNPDQARTKVMKEEVQIGDYKYRII